MTVTTNIETFSTELHHFTMAALRECFAEAIEMCSDIKAFEVSFKIYHGHLNGWSIEEISEHMMVDKTAVRTKIGFLDTMLRAVHVNLKLKKIEAVFLGTVKLKSSQEKTITRALLDVLNMFVMEKIVSSDITDAGRDKILSSVLRPVYERFVDSDKNKSGAWHLGLMVEFLEGSSQTHLSRSRLVTSGKIASSLSGSHRIIVKALKQLNRLGKLEMFHKEIGTEDLIGLKLLTPDEFRMRDAEGLLKVINYSLKFYSGESKNELARKT